MAMVSDTISMVPENSSYPTAISALALALKAAQESLLRNTKSKHTYRIVSSTEGLRLLDEMQRFEEQCGAGTMPEFDPDKFRAFVFQLGRPNADLQAYRAVTARVCLDLIEVALSSLRERKMSVLF